MKTSVRWLVFTIGVVVCLRCTDPPLPGGTSRPTCERNSDCREPQICSPQGSCVLECLDARDCDPGKACENNRCATTGTGLPTDAGGAEMASADSGQPETPYDGGVEPPPYDGGPKPPYDSGSVPPRDSGPECGGDPECGASDRCFEGKCVPRGCLAASPSSPWSIQPGTAVGTLTVSMILGDMRAVMGCDGVSNTATWSVRFASMGITVYLADSDLNRAFDSGDAVVSISVDSTFQGATAQGLRPGSPRIDVQAVHGGAQTSTQSNGIQDWYVTQGLVVKYDVLGVAQTLSVFNPQPGLLRPDIYPYRGGLGEQGRCTANERAQCFIVNPAYIEALNYPVTTIPNVKAMLSQVTPSLDGVPAPLSYILAYPHLGVMFSSSGVSQNGESLVSIVSLSAPFAGRTACTSGKVPPMCGNGIGSLRSEIEAELGAPVGSIPQGNVVVYRVGNGLSSGVLPIVTGKIGVTYDGSYVKSIILNVLN